MFLLAVSGGPDSMFLLNKYKNKNIVVAHVNYNKRKDSNIDQEIVESFCNKHKIPLEILSVKKIAKGNFQSEARKVRYNFFKKVYSKYKCNKLLTAHHVDDFIETALMEQKSNREPNQFGIAKKKIIDGMNIYRPFINSYFKEEIIKELKKANIRYAIDSSNEKPIYERNKIRLELKNKSLKEKHAMHSWFVMSNKILNKKLKRIDKIYIKWKASQFAIKKFKSLERDKQRLVFKFVHDNFKEIKLSTSKVKSLVDFIEGEKGGVSFKLNDKNSIKKEKGFLKIK